MMLFELTPRRDSGPSFAFHRQPQLIEPLAEDEMFKF